MLALIKFVGRADGPEHVRGRVVAHDAGRAVLKFPASNWDGDVTLLVSSLLAGERADRGQCVRHGRGRARTDDACHRDLGAARAVAVLAGGVGPRNAAEQVRARAPSPG
jgi:hypothetical protein